MPLLLATLYLGVYPKPVFDVTTPAVMKLVDGLRLHSANVNEGAAP